MVALLVKTSVREPQLGHAGDSDAQDRGEVPLTPSRYWLNQVSLLCFPGTARSGELAQLVTDLSSTVGSRIDLRPTTIMAGDLYDLPLRAAFGIQRLPSLVITGPWPKPLFSALYPRFELPAYCAIDDEEIIHDLGRLTKQAENLVKIFAGATTQEIKNVLHTRRFRMLVWKASSRSGDTIEYITDLTARFGLGSHSVLLAFDDRGWTAEVDPNQMADSGVLERPASELPSDPVADGLDAWADDGGAANPRVDVQLRLPAAIRAPGKRTRRFSIVGQIEGPARV